MPKRIDGGNAIYHYLQKIVIPRDDAFSRELVLRLVLDLSIWLPLELYCAVPLLLPYCVRDSSIRKLEWGTANAQGYLRDNNSILKLLVSSYAIRSPRFRAYDRAVRGRNFTASHAWRWLRLDGKRHLATAHPLAYSFVPNLAWLPAQIAKLTDHEGSFAQQVLQAVAWAYYAPARLAHPPTLAGIWDALQPPELLLDLDPTQLNTFVVSPRSIKIRRNNLIKEIDMIEKSLEKGAPAGKSPRSLRYLQSLSGMPRDEVGGMLIWLQSYSGFLASEG
jgi:hypothetical protein